jgi:hypothetical protein
MEASKSLDPGFCRDDGEALGEGRRNERFRNALIFLLLVIPAKAGIQCL